MRHDLIRKRGDADGEFYHFFKTSGTLSRVSTFSARHEMLGEKDSRELRDFGPLVIFPHTRKWTLWFGITIHVAVHRLIEVGWLASTPWPCTVRGYD